MKRPARVSRKASPAQTWPSRTGIIVPTEKGQASISILTELGLVDHRYKIGRSGGKLKLPLSRRPSSDELEQIEDRIGPFSTSIDHYEPQPKKPDSLEEALALLPKDVQAEVPRAFDIIGDLAIVDLSPQLEPFQGLVANALMQVHKSVKAVYGKTGPITGEERVRPISHIAGEARTVTMHREFGASFKVDIAKVFFSPRLSREHERVALLVRPGEQVLDMFAGVGPYSILIARAQPKAKVDAVDVNPEASRLMKENVRLNHVDERVTVWSGSVRDVVREAGLEGTATRAIMNHPSQAKQFVDTAVQALKPSGVIHYYTFGEGVGAEQSAVTEFEDSLERVDWNIEQTLVVRKVRGISPMSWQIVVDAQVAPS